MLFILLLFCSTYKLVVDKQVRSGEVEADLRHEAAENLQVDGGDDVGAAGATPVPAAERCVRDVYVIFLESVWPMSWRQKG